MSEQVVVVLDISLKTPVKPLHAVRQHDETSNMASIQRALHNLEYGRLTVEENIHKHEHFHQYLVLQCEISTAQKAVHSLRTFSESKSVNYRELTRLYKARDDYIHVSMYAGYMYMEMVEDAVKLWNFLEQVEKVCSGESIDEDLLPLIPYI